MLALSSVGVFLGRYQRFNSWDVFTDPKPILADLAKGLSNPLDYPKVFAVTVVFTGSLGYLSGLLRSCSAHSVAQRRVALRVAGDILSAMPFYQRLGDVPRKRHVQFRDNGTLLTEEVMGLEGFTGNESILYHLTSPCRVKELGDFEPIEREEWVPDAHAHRHFQTGGSSPRATRSPAAGY